MDRVKLSWTLGALSVGIFMALAALPSTNWLLKNAADWLRYGRAGNQMSLFPFTPSNLNDFRKIGDDAEAKFLAGRDNQELLKDGGEPSIRYAEAHPHDPEIWAETLYSLYSAPMHKMLPEDPADSQYWIYNTGEWPKYDKVRNAALRAAEHGLTLEPNNGFFAFAVADIAWAVGDRTKAASALEAASRCKEFKDYHKAEGVARFRILERHYGYRGEDARFDAYSRTRCPEYANQRAFSKEIAMLPHDKSGLLIRLRLLQVASLSAEQGSTLIGMLIDNSIAGIILRDGKKPPKDIASDRDKLDALVLARAPHFESELAAAGIPSEHPTPTEMVKRMAALAKAVRSYLSEDLNEFRVGRTPALTPEGVLIALLLSAAVAFAVVSLGAVLSVLPRGAASALLPYACSIGGCFAIATDHYDFIAPLLITFAGARCLPGIRKYGNWCNLAAVVALLSLNLTYVNVDPQNLAVATLFGLAWAATTFDFDARIILVASGVLLALVAVPILRGVMVLHDGSHIDYRTVAFDCLVLVAIFPFKRIKAVAAMPSVGFAISLLVLTYVANGVILNNKLRPAFNSLVNEADSVRRGVALGPRS